MVVKSRGEVVFQATAWRSGWTEGTLAEWAEKLLKRVVFKVVPPPPSLHPSSPTHREMYSLMSCDCD